MASRRHTRHGPLHGHHARVRCHPIAFDDRNNAFARLSHARKQSGIPKTLIARGEITSGQTSLPCRTTRVQGHRVRVERRTSRLSASKERRAVSKHDPDEGKQRARTVERDARLVERCACTLELTRVRGRQDVWPQPNEATSGHYARGSMLRRCRLAEIHAPSQPSTAPPPSRIAVSSSAGPASV